MEQLAELFSAQPAGEQVNMQVSAWLKLGLTQLAVGYQLPSRGTGWRLRLPDMHSARLTGPRRMVVYEGGCH